jgi:hypothetical protein
MTAGWAIFARGAGAAITSAIVTVTVTSGVSESGTRRA